MEKFAEVIRRRRRTIRAAVILPKPERAVEDILEEILTAAGLEALD